MPTFRLRLPTLYLQVLIAIALGALLGALVPEWGVAMKPLGDGFVKLIKMCIAPVIFLTVTVGVAGTGAMSEVGRVGLRALIYFETISNLALLIGFGVAKWLQPGAGFNVDASTLDSSSISKYTQTENAPGVVDFLLNIIPNTPFEAFVRGDILSVLFLAVLVGLALSALGERGRPTYDWLEGLMQLMFKLVHLIMHVAPIGAFGAMAFTIGKYGLSALGPMAKLMGSFYLTCALFIVIVLGLVARFCGFSLWRFLRYIRAELMIVLGTSSSESVLPRLLEKLPRLGADKTVVGLVLPAGYSFNLDGTNIYMTLAALFIAQATNTDLTLGQELLIVAVACISSNGAAGVTGSGFITLAATLAVVPTIPVAGMVLILGIDRFMSEARALTNTIGNGVATLAIAKWLGKLDSAQLKRELEVGALNEAELEAQLENRSVTSDEVGNRHG